MSIYHKSALLGVGLGALLTYVLFTQVGWYHDLLVWSWTNPWMYVMGLISGITVAVITDK